MLLIPILVIQGYGYSFFNESIDLCGDVKNILDKNIDPKFESGIGYFITCPPKDIRKNIYSSKYILSRSYDIIYNDLSQKVKPTFEKGLANKKRNNTYLNAVKDMFSDNESIKKGFDTLVNYNQMLTGLESLGTCEYAKNCINYIEEKFCYTNLDAQMNGFIYYSLASFGVLLVAIGLNKLSVFTREVVKYIFIISYHY